VLAGRRVYLPRAGGYRTELATISLDRLALVVAAGDPGGRPPFKPRLGIDRFQHPSEIFCRIWAALVSPRHGPCRCRRCCAVTSRATRTPSGPNARHRRSASPLRGFRPHVDVEVVGQAGGAAPGEAGERNARVSARDDRRMQVEHCHLRARAAGQDDADGHGGMPPSVAPGGIAVCDVAWPDDGNNCHVPDQERGVVLTADAMPCAGTPPRMLPEEIDPSG
jgi:hypothetical protein